MAEINKFSGGGLVGLVNAAFYQGFDMCILVSGISICDGILVPEAARMVKHLRESHGRGTLRD